MVLELAAQRAQKEQQLCEFRAQDEGDVAADDDPTALTKFVSAVIVGMGVFATSGSDRKELGRVAMIAAKAFDKRASVFKPNNSTGDLRSLQKRGGKSAPYDCS